MGLITGALNPPMVKPQDHVLKQGVKAPLLFSYSFWWGHRWSACVFLLCIDFRFITSLSLSWFRLHLGWGVFQRVPSLLQKDLWRLYPMRFLGIPWHVFNSGLAQDCTLCSKNVLSDWERLQYTKKSSLWKDSFFKIGQGIKGCRVKRKTLKGLFLFTSHSDECASLLLCSTSDLLLPGLEPRKAGDCSHAGLPSRLGTYFITLWLFLMLQLKGSKIKE